MTDTPIFQHEVDARGLRCPEPVMLLHACVRRAAPGDVIRVLADDPSTARDIPQFCAHLEHVLLAQQEANGEFVYYVRRKKQDG